MRKPTIDAGTDPMLALRVFIMAAGYSNQDLAEKIGMKPTTFCRKLKGKFEFKLSEVKAIASALDLSAEEAAQIFLG